MTSGTATRRAVPNAASPGGHLGGMYGRGLAAPVGRPDMRPDGNGRHDGRHDGRPSGGPPHISVAVDGPEGASSTVSPASMFMSAQQRAQTRHPYAQTGGQSGAPQNGPGVARGGAQTVQSRRAPVNMNVTGGAPFATGQGAQGQGAQGAPFATAQNKVEDFEADDSALTRLSLEKKQVRTPKRVNCFVFLFFDTTPVIVSLPLISLYL